MTTLLTIGPIHTLTEDAIYALPARKVTVISSAVLEVSNDSTTGFASVATTTTGAELVSSFVRCTTANAVVSLKV